MVWPYMRFLCSWHSGGSPAYLRLSEHWKHVKLCFGSFWSCVESSLFHLLTSYVGSG